MIKVTYSGKVPHFNLKWWKPTQVEWAPILRKDQEVPWRQESDPTTGRPWKSLTSRYEKVKNKKFPGQPILRATGEMEDKSIIFPWKTGFSVKAAFYGAFHQFGTKKMVARPWMGIPDKSLKQLPPIAWGNILSTFKSK